MICHIVSYETKFYVYQECCYFDFGQLSFKVGKTIPEHLGIENESIELLMLLENSLTFHYEGTMEIMPLITRPLFHDFNPLSLTCRCFYAYVVP